jgi:hypothetical protein
MTRGNTRDLRGCLFDAFVDPHYRDPQGQELMWAIREGLARFKLPMGPLSNWSETKARKDHECVRGCTIKVGDTYFRYITGPAWGDHLSICADCMAMILYFAEVDKLPPYMSTHWDFATQQPILKEPILKGKD